MSGLTNEYFECSASWNWMQMNIKPGAIAICKSIFRMWCFSSIFRSILMPLCGMNLHRFQVVLKKMADPLIRLNLILNRLEYFDCLFFFFERTRNGDPNENNVECGGKYQYLGCFYSIIICMNLWTRSVLHCDTYWWHLCKDHNLLHYSFISYKQKKKKKKQEIILNYMKSHKKPRPQAHSAQPPYS